MIKGVSEKEEIIIKSILKNFPYEFYYYGSRVSGNFTKGSDLDILLKNDKEIPYSEIEKIKTEFNESTIPYIVNISEYTKMDERFFKHIESTLVKVDFC